MKISRRNLLTNGALATVSLSMSAQAIAATSPRVVVFDSRFAQSRRWASTQVGHLIDVASASVELWQELSAIPAGSTVSALTRWSDFIALRGHLEATGMRLEHSRQRGSCFAWVMQ